MMGEVQHRCQWEVWQGGAWHRSRVPCNRLAKGQGRNGMWLCGIHLNAARRRQANDRARIEEQIAGERFAAEVRAWGDQHGIGVSVARPGVRTVVLKFDELCALLAGASTEAP
jgi:hypothetical protein